VLAALGAADLVGINLDDVSARAFCDSSSARRWFSVVCCMRHRRNETGNVDTDDQRLVAYPGDVAVGASRGFDQPSGALERVDFGRVASA
jgi:hypothetical protein